jgi:glycosyltransferase involved in cell wall biosynthesis
MRIAVVYQYFQGRGEPGHSVIYELTQHLAGQGHDVCVIAGETGYMKRSEAARSWPRRPVRREKDGPISILRTYCYSQLHRNYLSRLISFASFSVSCALCLLFIKRPEVLLGSSPPIFPVFTAGVVCRIRNIPFVFEVRDLWPASAVEMGILKSQWMIRVMAWMERWLYRHSTRIVCLTEGIRNHICKRGWPDTKATFIPCGIDTAWLYPDPITGIHTRNKHGWKHKQIVLYFGAMGEANNLHVLLKAAQRLATRRNTLFVLIGDGMQRPALEDQCRAMGLDDVLILPPVPKHEARSYINAADLCVVTLKNIPLFRGAIPTKLLEYMACGKPVLCGVLGEAADIVRSARCGKVFNPDDDEHLAKLIDELLSDETRAREMSMSGPEYIQTHFNAADMRRRMEHVLAHASADRNA